MENIITIVGFLGSGKTTLLKYLVHIFSKKGWSPFVILNDYENANVDAHQFLRQVETNQIKALTGSCICCNGIDELRNYINGITKRTNGITLIEANGTSDACSLMEFLGVGLNDRFLPPPYKYQLLMLKTGKNEEFIMILNPIKFKYHLQLFLHILKES